VFISKKVSDFNNSFSFGIGDNFFSSAGGSGSVNVGGFRPPNSVEVQNSLTSPATITNPITGAPFIDPNSSVGILGTTPGTVLIDPNGNINILEQDHRGIKRLVKPGMGFASFNTARRTIRGYEIMNMMRKGQVLGVPMAAVKERVIFGVFYS
jgi:hypothetical protein